MSLDYFIKQTELVSKMADSYFEGDLNAAELVWIEQFARIYHEEWRNYPEKRDKFLDYFWLNFIEKYHKKKR